MNGIAKTIILFVFLYFPVLSQTHWADTVHSYTSEKGKTLNSANQILGPPNTLKNNSTVTSWSPILTGERPYETITVGFDNEEVVEFLFLNNNTGKSALKGITTIDINSEENSINITKSLISEDNGKFTFTISPPQKVQRIKLIIDLNEARNDVEIDAVGIGNDITNVWELNEISSSKFSGIVKNMGSRINSIYSELAPVITADNQTLFFTRDEHPENIGADKKQDIWISKKEANEKFSKAINPYNPLNNDNNNFVFSTNSDGSKLIISSNIGDDKTPQLAYSSNSDNKWSELNKFDFVDLNKESSLVSYSLSQGQNLMFVSMEREDSYGGLDIYYSKKVKGEWSELVNLGPTINTAANEISPFIANDNKTLYFATDGWPGYGEMDLFVSRFDYENEHWSQAINLGSEINTEGWEAYLTISSSNNQAYFVSTSNSMGAEDIFTIELPEDAKPTNSIIVKGNVTTNIGSPLQSTIEYYNLATNELIGTANSRSKDGFYQITLPIGNYYGISANLGGYYPISQTLNLTKKTDDDVILNLTLKKIEKDSSFTLNNIFFEFGKSELNIKSTNELNKLVSLLNKNKSIKLRLIGFTDSVGSIESNKILSENRAKSVYNYLIKQGISADRLEYIGKGEIKSNKNTKLQEHRKVIFKIIEISK